jgi:hypothetical protein
MLNGILNVNLVFHPKEAELAKEPYGNSIENVCRVIKSSVPSKIQTEYLKMFTLESPLRAWVTVLCNPT